MADQMPTVGRTVLYRLSAPDAEQVNRRRTTSADIAARVAQDRWNPGTQAHVGNAVAEGDVYPMVVVKVWGTDPTSSVNGQVLLDGSDVLWVTSRAVGTQAGTWHWPERVN